MKNLNNKYLQKKEVRYLVLTLFTIHYSLFTSFGQTPYTGGKGDGFAMGSLDNAVAVGKSVPKISIISLYPTPLENGQNLHITLSQPLNKSINLRIEDICGKLVWIKQIETSQAGNEFSLKLPDLPQGNYILRMQGVDFFLSRKICILEN